MIMIVISFALVKFYALAILYVLIVMQIKLVVVVVVDHACNLCNPLTHQNTLIFFSLLEPFGLRNAARFAV